ncbi:alpha-L-rhamnosidase C-terminal domain-containing protein [Pseudomonas sp. yb_1]|uniref:alpha-L-rhamnosidase-related protein n=1 Tax=Pseudomonas sp. yb_1 TaxID=3367217 RepID=UPI00370CAA7A
MTWRKAQLSSATAARRLRELVIAGGYRIGTGFVGTPIISQALSSTGSLDVAYRQLQERGCPSWLYPIDQGATTIWERWDSQLEDSTVNPGQMTSFNHYALGAVAHWMHTTIAGITPLAPGYRKIAFTPQPGGGLTWAKASHDSPHGRIAIEWSIKSGVLTVQTTTPVNTTAALPMPSGMSFALSPGVSVHSESFA